MIDTEEQIYCIGSCYACRRPIIFHPDLVPSIRPYNEGAREPLCESCVGVWNRIHRTSKGLEPVEIRDGAYHPGPVV